MIHRIVINMMFTDKDAMDDILDKVKDHEDEAITINPGKPNQERSYWVTQECNHDEHHTGPCTDTGSWYSP